MDKLVSFCSLEEVKGRDKFDINKFVLFKVVATIQYYTVHIITLVFFLLLVYFVSEMNLNNICGLCVCSTCLETSEPLSFPCFGLI